MKIVLCGPPRSGKSCLREGLKQAIKSIPGAPYPYVITACPDGEGAWFQETVNHDPDQARQLKDEYKKTLGGFTPEFVRRIADSVANCNLPLTFVDIGGIPSKENVQICVAVTHAVLLMPKSMSEAAFQKLQEAYRVAGLGVPNNLEDVRVSWYMFAQKLGISIIVELCSDYHGQADEVPALGEDGVWRGSVHYLERGEPVAERPTIKKLAEVLVSIEK